MSGLRSNLSRLLRRASMPKYHMCSPAAKPGAEQRCSRKRISSTQYSVAILAKQAVNPRYFIPCFIFRDNMIATPVHSLFHSMIRYVANQYLKGLRSSQYLRQKATSCLNTQVAHLPALSPSRRVPIRSIRSVLSLD